MMRSYEQATFAAQEAELRRLLNKLPVARLSLDNNGIGMNLARKFPQVMPETFTNARKNNGRLISRSCCSGGKWPCPKTEGWYRRSTASSGVFCHRAR